jgi:hypothetical protein
MNTYDEDGSQSLWRFVPWSTSRIAVRHRVAKCSRCYLRCTLTRPMRSKDYYPLLILETAVYHLELYLYILARAPARNLYHSRVPITSLQAEAHGSPPGGSIRQGDHRGKKGPLGAQNSSQVPSAWELSCLVQKATAKEMKSKDSRSRPASAPLLDYAWVKHRIR